MNIFICEHPRTIKNPYTNEVLTIPCGHCKTCQKRKSTYWVDKLERERKTHPYCTFFTLTYNEEHCPKYHVVGNELVDFETGEVVYVPSDVLADNQDYLKRGYVCHPCVQHLQNFIKRIRSKVSYYETDKRYKRIRYYIVSEYGPKNDAHRIHYHGLLFYESKWLAENIKAVITSSWTDDSRVQSNRQLGFIKQEFVKSSASSYCAGYVTSTSDLPTVYQFKALHSLQLCSKHPAIGSLPINDEETRKILFEGTPRINWYDVSQSAWILKPLSFSLKNKLFPRIKGFSQISHSARVRLYEFIYERQQKITSVGSFIDYIRNLSPMEKNSLGQELCDYLFQMLPIYDYDLDGFSSIFNYTSFKKDPYRLRAHRFYSCCNRVYFNMCIFGVGSVEKYVSLIEQFYQNCEKENLKDYFTYQEQFDDDAANLLFFDPRFCYRVKSCSEPNLDIDTILQGYGISQELCFDFDFRNNKYYRDMVNKSKEFKSKTEKKRERNAYLRNKSFV